MLPIHYLTIIVRAGKPGNIIIDIITHTTNGGGNTRMRRNLHVGAAIDDKNSNHTHTHKQPTYIQILRTLTLHSTAIA